MWPTIARTLTTLDALLLLKATTMYVSLVRNLLGHYEVGTIADIGTFGQNGRGCVHSRSLDSYLDFLPSTFQHSAGFRLALHLSANSTRNQLSLTISIGINSRRAHTKSDGMLFGVQENSSSVGG
jgi:hypothetical protein